MERDPFLEITHEWYVWHIGDDDFKRVGELRGKNRVTILFSALT